MPPRLPAARLRNALVRPRRPAIITTPTTPTMPSLPPSSRHNHSTPSPPLFTYLLGASASAKSHPLRAPDLHQNIFNPSTLRRDPSTCCHFTSTPRHSGEDAFFLAHIARSPRHALLAVADGVGGWNDSGVNPADFSHGLCRHMALRTARPDSTSALVPQTLLQFAYDRVHADAAIAAGGSTACVAALTPAGALETANLGDSGWLVLGPGKVAAKSTPQTHAFNTPFQLSKLTPKMRAQNAIFGHNAQISESPAQADTATLGVRHGDVVLLATDGVWDNLAAMDVLGVVGGVMRKGGYWAVASSSAAAGEEARVVDAALRPTAATDAAERLERLPGDIAYAVMRAAKVASLNTRRDGPFAREVQKYYPGEDWHGGKVDDIAVVVGVCVQDAPEGAGGAEPRIKAKL